ncbi:MAG: ABC transporter permease, partial [Candidatus Acidiferrales bacterium]
MNSFWHDLSYAARLLARQPGFTLVAMLTLALGIGATTAIFSVVNGVLLQPLPYAEPDQLMILRERSARLEGMSVAYPNFLDWRAQSRTFAQLAAFRGATFTLTGSGEPDRLQGLEVSANFLTILGASPTLGRNFAAEEDQPG